MDNQNLFPKEDSCIFCKIAAGAIPCEKLYEDDKIISFLDVGPLSKGHALVIPKGHWATVDQLPQDVSAAIGAMLPALSKAICGATGATAWNILQNNGHAAHQEVDHVHFHIIPKADQAGLGINWPSGSIGQEELISLGKAIRSAL